MKSEIIQLIKFFIASLIAWLIWCWIYGIWWFIYWYGECGGDCIIYSIIYVPIFSLFQTVSWFVLCFTVKKNPSFFYTLLIFEISYFFPPIILFTNLVADFIAHQIVIQITAIFFIIIYGKWLNNRVKS